MVRAKLTVHLLAEDEQGKIVIVGESEDQELWQIAMARIVKASEDKPEK